MREVRRQLALFVDDEESVTIENIRKQFNPRQYELIRSHVTLCRDEELNNIETILKNLRDLHYPALILTFGKTVRSSNGDGVLMPVIDGVAEFQRLRKIILKDAVVNIKSLQPHITLMHPRNSKCTDAIFGQIQKIVLPRRIEFRKISLIEQIGGSQWEVLAAFDLF